MDVYNSPLYYDIAFEDGTDKEADFIVKEVRRHATKIGSSLAAMAVYEPMCGSCRLLRRVVPLVRIGYGMDVSGSAVQYASSVLGNLWKITRLSVGSVTSSVDVKRLMVGDFGHIDVAFNTINSFRELGIRGGKDHLKLMRRVVAENGIYILGLHLLPSPVNRYRPQPEESSGMRDGVFVTSKLFTSSVNSSSRIELVDFEMSITENGQTSVKRQQMKFTTYTRSQMEKAIESSGWSVRCMYDFSYKKLAKICNYQEDVIFVLERKDKK